MVENTWKHITLLQFRSQRLKKAKSQQFVRGEDKERAQACQIVPDWIENKVEEMQLVPDNVVHVDFGTSKSGTGVCGVGGSRRWCLDHIPLFSTAVCNSSCPCTPPSFKTPNRCIPSSAPAFPLHFEAVVALFFIFDAGRIARSF